MTDPKPLPLELGAAVAKAACHLWISPPAAAVDLSLSLGQIFGRRVTDALSQKRGERAFERIGEELAVRIGAFIDVEYGSLPSFERLAAVGVVQRLFERVPLNAQSILTADLSPLPIEQQLRTAGAAIIRGGVLSPAATAFFDQLLTDCCNYVIEILVTLPDFSVAATTELLRRETVIINLIQQMLERLPASAPTSLKTDSNYLFEVEYKRQLLRQLDWLELFGIELSASSRRYALSVAYVSLDVNRPGSIADEEWLSSANSSTSLLGLDGDSDDGNRADDAEERQAALRVETALAQGDRFLLRGEAGSGKTTLLRWLAVRAARSDFTGELSRWNGKMPFVIELRRFVGKELPGPEEFLSTVAKPMLARKPASWATDRLGDGDCLVLVDGLDELPADEREAARAWLRDLVAVFPAATYVVTSRPGAVNNGWLIDIDFVDNELQQMTPEDTEAFIEKWHAAVQLGLSTPEELDELADYERSLKRVVRRTPALRNLATTPLLCAMLCGLNRDRRKQLPQDRLGLYRVALESLLERRDMERGVAADSVATFGLDEKLLLLQDLAHWLLVNGMTSCDTEQALARFESKLTNMPRMSADGQSVLRHMLVRSGVLRQPIEGRIDFVHRTFLEYLAALETVNQDSMGMLVQHAHLDQWREVVVLAAGRASTTQRERLISEMLSRADGESADRHVIQLLAIACLETSPELSGALQARLNTLLEQLVPPNNVSEARALASAGDLAAHLLHRDSNWNVHQATASIRCLAFIGTDAALDALSTYMTDSRVMVGRELIKAWDNFDPVSYAERVLAENGLDRGMLRVVNPALVPAINGLQKLTKLTLETRSKPVSYASLTGLPLYRVDLRHNKSIVDLQWLRNAGELTHLDLERCVNLSDTDGLIFTPKLRWLDMSGTESVAAHPNLPDEHLTALLLNATPWLHSLDAIGELANLTVLQIRDNENLSSIEGVGHLRALRSLKMSNTGGVSDLSPIAALTALVDLDLSDTSLHDTEILSACESLRVAKFVNTGVRDLRGLGGLHLSGLDVSGCAELQDLTPLRGMSSLSQLRILGTQARDLTPLAEVNELVLYTSSPVDELRLPSSADSWRLISWPWWADMGGEVFF